MRLSITKYSIIPIRSVTVLGNMPVYIQAATATGFGYYLISQDLWERLPEAASTANNMQYLADANLSSSQFVVVLDRIIQAGTAL